MSKTKILMSVVFSVFIIALLCLFFNIFNGLKDELDIAKETVNNLPKIQRTLKEKK